MMIKLSKKLEDYLQKNNILNLILRIAFFTEGCILIKEPKIEVINDQSLKDFKDYEKICNDKLTLFISEEFKEIYGTKEDFILELGGKLIKKIILLNYQPIIIRTCKL